MFLFQFVKHFIETVIEIYEIPLIWWVDPQYPWSQGIGSPIWGSSMTRVKLMFSPVNFIADSMFKICARREKTHKNLQTQLKTR